MVMVVRRSHQLEQLVRPVKSSLIAVSDPSDDPVPTVVRLLRRCESNDEGLHPLIMTGGLQVAFG